MSAVGVQESGINHVPSTLAGLHVLTVGLALAVLVPTVKAQICFCYPAEYCVNQKCEKCPSGTFQPEVGYKITSCKPWTQKGIGWVVETMGTNKTDTFWKCADGFFLVNSTECRVKESISPLNHLYWLLSVIVLTLIIITLVIYLRHRKRIRVKISSNVNTSAQYKGSSAHKSKIGFTNVENAATCEPLLKDVQKGVTENSIPKVDSKAKEDPIAELDPSPAEDLRVNRDSKVKKDHIAELDPSPMEDSSIQDDTNIKKLSENYVAQLDGLMKNIKKLISPEDLYKFYKVYLEFDKEEEITDLANSYLQWARQNPKYNFALKICRALETFGYTLPDQGNDDKSNLEGLKMAVKKKIQLKKVFRKLCYCLRRKLGKDVLPLFSYLNLVPPVGIDDEYIIPPLVDWALRGALPVNGTWGILEKLKRALRDIERNDIVENFEVLAKDVILECKNKY